jgi:HAD superfamily hydrolase (TIGR01490 family)
MNLALFDLDNTLLAGDSDYEWAQFLIAKGVVDAKIHAEKNDQFFEQYKAGTLDIHAFLDFQLAPLSRHPRAQLMQWHADFMRTRILPLVTPAARMLVAQHAANGDLMCVVTATNSFVTTPIAFAFGIPHLIGTIPATHMGEFTGKVQGIPSFREGKITRVEAWLEAMGFWWTNFERSWFYSDSLNDLPLLEKVTDPIAVDADATLRAVAVKNNWPHISLR